MDGFSNEWHIATGAIKNSRARQTGRARERGGYECTDCAFVPNASITSLACTPGAQELPKIRAIHYAVTVQVARA